LGNAMVYGFFYLTMLIFSPFAKKHLFYLFGISAVLAPLGWFFLKAYQKARILSFLNPHLDTQGTAYNMIQAVITIGSGKFFLGGDWDYRHNRNYFFYPKIRLILHLLLSSNSWVFSGDLWLLSHTVT